MQTVRLSSRATLLTIRSPRRRSFSSEWFVLEYFSKTKSTTISNYILSKSSGIDEMNYLNWKLVGALFASWIIVVLALIKGIQSSGKVNMITQKWIINWLINLGRLLHCDLSLRHPRNTFCSWSHTGRSIKRALVLFYTQLGSDQGRWSVAWRSRASFLQLWCRRRRNDYLCQVSFNF